MIKTQTTDKHLIINSRETMIQILSFTIVKKVSEKDAIN